MVQPIDDGAAAVAVDDVDASAPDNSQAAEKTESPENTDAADFYADDQAEQAPVEDEEEPAGDEAEEPIDAPVSLKAEEKKQFEQLPTEAQRVLSEVLQRRDRETQQGLEAARAAQREAQTSAADEIAQTKRTFAQQSASLLAAFAPQPPPLEMARDNPAEYQYRKALFEEESAGFNQLVQNLTGIHQEAEGHFTQREQEANAERLKGLMSIPEIASEETRGQFFQEIEAFGTTHLGYSVEALAQMDATDVAALKRAMADKTDAEKWRAHQKKRNDRPREAQGRFAAAPVGARAAGQAGQADVLKTLYPND